MFHDFLLILATTQYSLLDGRFAAQHNTLSCGCLKGLQMYEPYEVGITNICAMKMDESPQLQFLRSMLGDSYCSNFLSKENKMHCGIH